MSSFECKKCGKCCSNILPLSKADKDRIRKRKNLVENVNCLLQDWYLTCPFLNTHNMCDIYEDRPAICRGYSCENFEKHTFEGDFLQDVMSNKFEITDMRKEFFGKEECGKEFDT